MKFKSYQIATVATVVITCSIAFGGAGEVIVKLSEGAKVAEVTKALGKIIPTAQLEKAGLKAGELANQLSKANPAQRNVILIELQEKGIDAGAIRQIRNAYTTEGVKISATKGNESLLSAKGAKLVDESALTQKAKDMHNTWFDGYKNNPKKHIDDNLLKPLKPNPKPVPGIAGSPFATEAEALSALKILQGQNPNIKGLMVGQKNVDGKNVWIVQQDIARSADYLLPAVLDSLNGQLIHGYAQVINSTTVTTAAQAEKLASEVHNVWVKANAWDTNNPLLVEYSKLSAAEKLKDLDVVNELAPKMMRNRNWQQYYERIKAETRVSTGEVLPAANR